MFDESKQNGDDIGQMFMTVENMTGAINKLKSEMDRLEEFSRRDSLRMYGVPHNDVFEDYDACARAVVDVLNSVDGPKKFTIDDHARAHRIGESRKGEPKSMIIKFSRCKDKMAIITDRRFRDNLAKREVRVVNDLTRTQAGSVAETKEAKVAYFRKRQAGSGTKTTRSEGVRRGCCSRRQNGHA